MATILIIDDDPLIRSLLQEILAWERYRVVSAADGEEGVRLARADRPDLVVTDILMRKKDGLTVIRELRAWDGSLPIIAMSGGDPHFLREHLLDVAQVTGADAMISKPFEHKELLDMVRTLLQKREAVR